MFIFGSTEENARLFQDLAAGVQGPKVPDIPVEEMTNKMLEIHMTYARMAYMISVQQGATQEVQDYLLNEYDILFSKLCEISESFIEVIKSNRHRYVGEPDPESIAKYRKIAGID
jgi:hypothetical protein